MMATYLKNTSNSVKKNRPDASAADIEWVKRIYDSDQSPLAFQIKPSGTIEWIEANRKITKEDFPHRT